MIKETIDIAAGHRYAYVNIHPGSRAKINLDLKIEKFKLIDGPIDLDRAVSEFILNLKVLNQYASAKSVLLTVETTPARVINGWNDPVSNRNSAFDVFELPDTVLLGAAGDGIAIANDFGHTAASVVNGNASTVWKHLYDFTSRAAPVTRLLHLGFLVPPYNGTDLHDSLANPSFNSSGAVPNKLQTLELLKLFDNRPDVYMLVEPNGGHVENYFLAKKLLDEAGV
jgi:hypothetical protein